MQARRFGALTAAAAVAMALVVVMGAVFAAYAAGDNRVGTRDEFILRIGAQDDIETKNIFGHSLSPDVWTSNVLAPMYDGVLQTDPDTDALLPYVARGVDFDEKYQGISGTPGFDLSEVGEFSKQTGTDQRTVTVYYDLNGLEYHDGTQVTVEDLLFSYHSDVKIPTTISKDVIKDQAGLAGTNYSTTRWLHIYPYSVNLNNNELNIWEDEDTGFPSTDPLRVAIQFRLQGDYYDFYRSTISIGFTPQHVWNGTGSEITWPTTSNSPFAGQTIDCTHADWGIAVDPTTWNGVPDAAGNAWDLTLASEWTVPDGCMIGTGPFVWETWSPGNFAKLRKNTDFFTTTDGAGYEYIHAPFLDGMLFKIYKTVQAAVFALQANEIDIISWSIPPDQVSDLQNNPDITVTSNAEKGFFYLAYHMQIAGGAPWSYENGDPANPDAGIPFRQAMAHTIDKKQIVTSLLQNFGVIADGVVSPVSTRWYNASLPQYDFDLTLAANLLDVIATDPPGECLDDGTNCRNFPGWGTQQIDIQCPQADYDAIRAAACSMMATSMRQVGVNVVADHLAFSQIVINLDNRDMRMWILGWRIGSDPPDYLHAFFYSGNYPDGQNYEGYANPTFDTLVTDIRANLDTTSQAEQVKYAQGILSTELPYDVLYYRTNIEAYRNDRTSNWTVGPAGSIFGGSYWSRIGVEPPKPGALRGTVTTASAVASGGSIAVTATVRDPDNSPVAGADVTLRATGGTWSNPETDPLITKGSTLATGKFTTTYIAPQVVVKQKVFISVSASDPTGEFGESVETSTVVTVFPPGVEFLSVIADPSSTVTQEGDPIIISVTVSDQDQIRVADANVTTTVAPSGEATLTPDTAQTTDSTGTVAGGFTFQLSDLRGSDFLDFDLTFNATKSGFVDAPGAVMLVTVFPELVPDVQDKPPPIPFIGIVAIIAVVGIAAVTFGILRERKKRA